MATVLELARHAEVSAENVLRVLNGEPVSGEVSARVRAAIEELGAPSYPGNGLASQPGNGSLELARRELLETLEEAASELHATLPEGVGSVVYEALRVEVRPVAQHVAQMERLVDRLVARFEENRDGIEVERRERLEDVALLVELITSGWRNVDRRLGRLERMMERLGDAPTKLPRAATHEISSGRRHAKP